VIPIIHSSKREEWLAARDSMFCASEIAQLLCEGYAKTEAERAAQRQVCITAKALRERFPQEESMDTASKLEPFVLGMARDLWWPDLPELGASSLVLDGWLYQDGRLACLGATPDALVVGGGDHPLAVVDCKISATKAQEDIKPKKDGSPSEASFANGCPIYYAIQLQSQMAVTGAQEGWLVVLHHQYPPGLKLRRYHVPRHPLLIERIRREVASSWTEVEAIREGRSV
jgi:hypothetical protein